ncbi:hypothetical protein ACFL2J_00925 [Candidatus Omnitrophota bacterium]
MRYVYALIALISAFSAVFLSPFTKVIYWGTVLGNLPSVIINSILVLLPLILYFGFSRPTVTIWYISFLYHLFFIGNSLLAVLSLVLPNSTFVPLIEISGKSSFASFSFHDPLPILAIHLFSIFNITMLAGIVVIWYLWQVREYFMPKSVLSNI